MVNYSGTTMVGENYWSPLSVRQVPTRGRPSQGSVPTLNHRHRNRELQVEGKNHAKLGIEDPVLRLKDFS